MEDPAIAAYHCEEFGAYCRDKWFGGEASGSFAEVAAQRDGVANFKPYLGLACCELPVHPQLLVDYYKERRWAFARDAGSEQSFFMVEDAADVEVPIAHAAPCQSRLRNVCPKMYSGCAHKFGLIKQGLTKIVDDLGPKVAKLAEATFMIVVAKVLPDGTRNYEHKFMTLTLPIYSPKVQVFALSCLVDVGSGARLAREGRQLDPPFFVRLEERRCKVFDNFRSLDERTGEDLALYLAEEAHEVHVMRLQYEVMPDIRIIQVTEVGKDMQLYAPGQKVAYGVARARDCLSALPKGSPFASKGRGGRGPRGPSAKASSASFARGGGRGRGRGGAEASADAAAPLEDGLALDLGDLLGEIIEEAEDVGGEAHAEGLEGLDLVDEVHYAWAEAFDDEHEWPTPPGETGSHGDAASTTDAFLEPDDVGEMLVEASGFAAASSSSSSSSAPPAPAGPPADVEAPQAAVVAADSEEGLLAGVHWLPADEGGYVFRHGKVVGRLSKWKNNLSVSCSMHGCRMAVSSSVGEKACVLWLLRGIPLPDGLALKETRAQKADLKQQHLTWPKPKCQG